MRLHQQRNWLHAVLLFILAFLPLSAHNQDFPDAPEPGQLPGIGALTIEMHRAAGEVCGGPLFDANGAATGQLPRDPIRHVDYCRELVIVDPTVLKRLERLSFREVLHTITSQSTDVRTEEDLNREFRRWVSSWGDESHRTFGRSYVQRSEVAALLADAWQEGHILLIAVVNRLDLEEPEGRLVFQVHEPCCNPQVLAPQQMGIIVEFALPPPPTAASAADHQATKQHWAERWHRLGRADLDADSYHAELQVLVEDFVTKGRLKQIRTNEQYRNSLNWELREYDASLNPRVLEKTPSEAIRNNASQSWLTKILGRADIRKALREGNHSFMKEPVWIANAAMLARFSSNGTVAWQVLSGLEHESMLMSFNTCNGCHRNVLDGSDGAMHLQRILPDEPARLSPLLSFKLHPPYQLPPCILDAGTLLGCAEDSPGKPAWNEVEFRAHNLVTLNAMNKGLFEESVLPNLPSPLYYRYH